MVAIERLRVTWSGAPVVGGGLSTFYSSDSSSVGLADAVFDFFNSIAAQLPAGTQIQIPSGGDILESTTGDLAGSWNDPGTGGLVTVGGGATFINGVGARVVWNTSGLYHGRRVRGSTFIVPLWSGAYEGAGNLVAATITALQTAGNALIGAYPDLAIWSNPRGGSDGEVNNVTSCIAPDFVSWLRSRRT